ncbi:segregation/condensation protein A [Synechococcus sp. BA-132 BA5]|uniref:segregation/condensation protein A n=1 Tax=Synechococcus sp. BA-132 BA5 TaxID=3110252 RepID=UPI002B21AC7A|nr:segregation/condensation protein A [Synechococcus sp. BA-132 BA5]MEA5416822.1 segregation/condensation protein A [Synechococcus sp. BA-132 BA5]
MAEAGARLAIRLLQDAAERGDIDPWDVDVIAVVDGFLDQLRQRIELPRRLAPQGGSYERDLAESSEAFLAASVLVGLKAELLESATFPPEPLLEDPFSAEDDDAGWDPGALALPRRPERHLQRRPVAPPPLQRPVTLGELIRQLEDIAERLEQDGGEGRHRPRARRYSERAAIAQVASLAHREKLPETTAALSRFLLQWTPTAESLEWVGFDALVGAWAEAVESTPADEDLDRDRVGVFWALLFLSSQGKVELEQTGGLYGPLSLRRCREERVESLSLPRLPGQGSDRGPALEAVAA